MQKSVLFLSGAAVLLVAAAGVTRFAVYPRFDQVPANLDTTVAYTGTASMLNPAALSGGSGNLLLTGIPITANQHVKVTGADGRTAVVRDQVTTLGPGNAQLAASSHTYAVDRVDLGPAAAPAGSNAEPHQGLAVGFPLSPRQTTYPYWDATVRSTAPATFTGSVTVAGRAAYGYTLTSAGVVADPATLAGLPKSLPKATVAALAATLPADRQAPVIAAESVLPADVPLTYTSTTTTQADVDIATGTVLSATKKQTVTANLDLGGTRAEIVPVLSLDIATTPATVATAAHDAQRAERGLTLLSTVLPWTGAGLGVVCAGLAGWMSRRRAAGAVRARADSVAS